MYSVEIDVAAVVAIWMGAVLLLVPLLGMVARWGVAPALEALARARSAGAGGAGAELLGRFARQEERLAELARAVERLESLERRF